MPHYSWAGWVVKCQCAPPISLTGALLALAAELAPRCAFQWHSWASSVPERSAPYQPQHPAKVVSDFQGAVVTDEEMAKTSEEVQEAAKGSRKRQFAWLSKSGFVSHRRASWRPQKRHREGCALPRPPAAGRRDAGLVHVHTTRGRCSTMGFDPVVAHGARPGGEQPHRSLLALRQSGEPRSMLGRSAWVLERRQESEFRHMQLRMASLAPSHLEHPTWSMERGVARARRVRPIGGRNSLARHVAGVQNDERFREQGLQGVFERIHVVSGDWALREARLGH